MSAWLDEEGIPKYHVVTFQAMAPASPPKTTGRIILVWLTIPLAMVAATFNERNAPTRLRTLLKITAVLGFNAPVATVGATALAVS
jgi:hypothetical protein